MSEQPRYVVRTDVNNGAGVYIVDTERPLAVKGAPAPVVQIFEGCPEMEKMTSLFLFILNMKGRFDVYVVPEPEQEEEQEEEQNQEEKGGEE